MKTIIALFKQFFKWLIQLFKRKTISKIVSKSVLVNPSENGPVYRPTGYKARIHNNRRRTNGRKIQYIDLGNGHTKPIFHT